MQDKEETTPWSFVACCYRKERKGWVEAGTRREAKTLEVMWDEAGGVPANPDGESHDERAQANSTRREREREAPGGEGQETKKVGKEK